MSEKSFEMFREFLPLRAMTVTLEFTDTARFSFFHQPAVHAFIRGLLGSPADYSLHFTLDAPETGCAIFAPGNRYRFTVYVLAGGERMLAERSDL